LELAASVELPDYVALARTSDILPGEGEPAGVKGIRPGVWCSIEDGVFLKTRQG
jgi:hypothetical protein